METERFQHLMRAFVLPHFGYCPLVLMFYDRTMNHRIYLFMEGQCALRIKITEVIWFSPGGD